MRAFVSHPASLHDACTHGASVTYRACSTKLVRLHDLHVTDR